MGIIFWGQLFTILKLLGNSTNIYKLLLIVFWWWIRKQSPSFLSHSPQSLPVVNYLVLLITYFSLPIWIFRFSFISGTFFFPVTCLWIILIPFSILYLMEANYSKTSNRKKKSPWNERKSKYSDWQRKVSY